MSGKMSPNVGLGMSIIKLLVVLACFYVAIQEAYRIRLYAIKIYGKIIHEFDPWFNYRATEYLSQNTLSKFFTWFDYMSWYPLGRPVGTTIYPGMQIASVAIWRLLRWVSRKSIQQFTLGLGNVKMSLNDVCVFVPAWFGAVASVLTGLLTYEVYRSWFSAGVAALIMAVIPAHIMRSVGGGYDNESVAMTAMVLTFWTWCLALRRGEASKAPAWRPYVCGIAAGLSYAFMVWTWGGFIFVGNLVAVHAAVITALGYFSAELHVAYTMFYIRHCHCGAGARGGLEPLQVHGAAGAAGGVPGAPRVSRLRLLLQAPPRCKARGGAHVG